LSLYNELKRRSVFRVGAAYVVAAWLLIQVAETIFPLFGFDDTPARIVVVVLAIGFLPSLIFAWAFELTPEGLKKDRDVDHAQSIAKGTGKKLDRVIMVVLVLALGYFAFDKFVLTPQHEATQRQQQVAELEVARQSGRTEALVESYGDKSIAVLPFADMSPEGDQAYFSDGIAEELLNVLAGLNELRVISRSSSFALRDDDLSIPEVAEKLNVAYVLEGSVRKAGNQVRITAQLIEARSDTHLWSENYDRELDSIFQIQDEIAAAVVDGLKITLLGAIPGPRKTDTEVYSLYLRGKYLMTPPQGDRENLEKAVTAFKQALAIDPDYAPAWVGLSWAYEYQTRVRAHPEAQGTALAREAVERALAIDDNMALAWSTLSYLKKKYEWDWDGAKFAMDKALQLEPNNVGVLLGTASVASALGQLDRSIELFERAVVLDPLGLEGLLSLGSRYIARGRYEDALALYQQVLVLYPENDLWARTSIAEVHLRQGDPERALAEIDRLPYSHKLNDLKAEALFILGEEEESRALTREFLNTPVQEYPFPKARIYAWRGENDAAFEALEAAFDQHQPGLANFLLVDAFHHLESDPRYPVFLEKLGLLEAWQAMPRD
jgi:TolB-like protein/Tfp pilus assembly protein PilF